jgi:hypothetical protein
VSIVALDESASQSHSHIDMRGSSGDFSGDSQFTTMPKAQQHEDIHGQNTLILENGGRRSSQQQASQRAPTNASRPNVNQNTVPRQRGRTQPPPVPARGTNRQQGARPPYDEELHSAPTMIIDINRMRRRG